MSPVIPRPYYKIVVISSDPREENNILYVKLLYRKEA